MRGWTGAHPGSAIIPEWAHVWQPGTVCAGLIGWRWPQFNTLCGRRHRLHIRAGLSARNGVAQDHGALPGTQHQLRHRFDAGRDHAEPGRAEGRWRLSAGRPAEKRPVRERHLCMESGGRRAGSRPAFLADRTHQLWITPHGVIRAAIKNNPTVVWKNRGGKSLAAVSFTDPGRYSATAYINQDYLVGAKNQGTKPVRPAFKRRGRYRPENLNFLHAFQTRLLRSRRHKVVRLMPR